jgi:hypothetical protein
VLAWITLSSATAVADEEPPARSPDGRYVFTLDTSSGEGKARILVRQRRAARTIARIDPNPGGRTRNLVVRFVAADNLLASWGCGTYCEETVLFTPRGRRLASFGAHHVSADGSFAVSFSAFEGPGVASEAVDIFDLRTGRKRSTSKQAGAWNTCGARWLRTQVTLTPCDARTRPIVVALPSRSRKR